MYLTSAGTVTVSAFILFRFAFEFTAVLLLSMQFTSGALETTASHPGIDTSSQSRPQGLHFSRGIYRRKKQEEKAMNTLLGFRLCTATAAMLFICTEVWPVAFATAEQPLAVAIWLKRKANSLNQDVCEELGTCETAWEDLPRMSLHLPDIDDVEECFPPKFEREVCLRRLSRALYVFSTFLKYLCQHLYATEPHTYFWEQTEKLAQTTKSLMDHPSTLIFPDVNVAKSVEAVKAAHIGWTPSILRHLVLRKYTEFMDATAKAYLYIKRN